ncbi:MAG: NUDIX hydrolase [Gammaproteobacteria bacterium]|nr:NUDIX hydrolase [Gammaproteobacteria bacterium]
MTNTFRPVTPLLTVDIIIEMTDRAGLPIVLIERKHPPYGWALPGGFVDVGETLEAAAVREAREETSLDVILTELLGVYSDPRRDQRGHTVSAVYIAQASGEPRAADDAANLRLCSAAHPPGVMAFDHQKILGDYIRFKTNGVRPRLQP